MVGAALTPVHFPGSSTYSICSMPQGIGKIADCQRIHSYSSKSTNGVARAHSTRLANVDDTVGRIAQMMKGCTMTTSLASLNASVVRFG